jgi:hypothetical protein
MATRAGTASKPKKARGKVKAMSACRPSLQYQHSDIVCASWIVFAAEGSAQRLAANKLETLTAEAQRRQSSRSAPCGRNQNLCVPTGLPRLIVHSTAEDAAQPFGRNQNLCVPPRVQRLIDQSTAEDAEVRREPCQESRK